MNRLYLDCFSGLAGDMLVGALLDLGADFTALEDGLGSLELDGYIGPVWFTVDGKPSLETCDMPAGGFRLRATFAELDQRLMAEFDHARSLPRRARSDNLRRPDRGLLRRPRPRLLRRPRLARFHADRDLRVSLRQQTRHPQHRRPVADRSPQAHGDRRRWHHRP